MKQYNFTLTENQTSIILNALANRPYGEVFELIAEIQRQASETMATLGNKNAFQASAISDGTGYIYVPSALVESYKAATNWSTYAARFRALEDYTVDGTITGALDESKL